MKGSPVFFIIFIRPTMQHQPPHHPPYAFLWARLTFAYEEYLHVRVEVTRERIWKSQDAHRARNNTRCKNEIFHAVRTKWYALSAPLGSKAHTSILLHPTPVPTTIVIRDLPHWPNKTWRIHHTVHVAITTSMVEDCRFSRKNALFFTQKRNGKLDWRVWREAIRITRISPHRLHRWTQMFYLVMRFSHTEKRTVEDGLPLINKKRMDMFPFLFCENKEDTKKVPPNIVEGTSLELITESTGKSGISD